MEKEDIGDSCDEPITPDEKKNAYKCDGNITLVRSFAG